MRKNIVGNKITVLLGAGATSGFIEKTTTKNLTEELFNEDRWNKVISLFRSLAEEEKDKAPLINAWEILKDFNAASTIQLLNHIRKKLEEISMDINFENIIYILDKICLYLDSIYIGRKSSKSNKDIDEILIDFFSSYETSKKRLKDIINEPNNSWIITPLIAREVIAQTILNYWNELEPDTKLKAKSKNEDFLKYILGKYESVNIYSLNYDPLIYESCKSFVAEEQHNFITGFEKDNHIFNAKSFFTAKNVLAFPHGHIAFIPLKDEDNNEPYYDPYKVSFDENYERAQEKRHLRDFTVSFNDSSNRRFIYNTALIVGLGYSKIDSVLRNPFKSYFHRFAIDIAESDCILSIGYSFRDEHINAYLLYSDKSGKKIKNITNVNDYNMSMLTYFKEEEIYEEGFENFIKSINDQL